MLLFKHIHTKWSQQHSTLTFVEEPFWISHYWLHREGMMLNLSEIANQSDISSPDHPKQSERSRSLIHFWLLFPYTCLKCSKLSLSTISIDQYNSYENKAQGNKPVLPLQALKNTLLPLPKNVLGLFRSHILLKCCCALHTNLLWNFGVLELVLIQKRKTSQLLFRSALYVLYSL